jgi:hypothetical protein
MQADPLFTSLDPTQVIGVHVRFLGQLLLAEASFLPVVANRCAKDFERLSSARHSFSRKQEGPE